MLSMSKNTLDVEKISELRRIIEKKNSVFADMRYLDNMFLPSEIIGRFQESEELLKILMGFDKGLPVPFVSIYGRSGSGKSTVTQFVCQEISDIIELPENVLSKGQVKSCVIEYSQGDYRKNFSR